MNVRKVFRYLFAALLVSVACLVAWEYGFETWASAVGIPLTFFIAGLTAFGPELYEGLSVSLPGDSAVKFKGDEECDHE